MKQVGIIEGGELGVGFLDPATLRAFGIEAEGDIGMIDGREQSLYGGELLGGEAGKAIDPKPSVMQDFRLRTEPAHCVEEFIRIDKATVEVLYIGLEDHDQVREFFY